MEVSKIFYTTGITCLGLPFFAAYERASAQVNSDAGNYDLDELVLEFYGLSFLKSELFIKAIFGGSYDWYKLNRNVSSASLKASVGGCSFDGLLAVGYDFLLGNITITPEIGAQYLFAGIDEYHERGDEYSAVSCRSQTLNALETLLSLRMSGVWGCSTKWIPEVRGSWQYQCLDKNSSLVFAPVGLDEISTIQILGPNRNTFIGGASVRCESATWSGELIYDVQIGKSLIAQYGSLEVGFRF